MHVPAQSPFLPQGLHTVHASKPKRFRIALPPRPPRRMRPPLPSTPRLLPPTPPQRPPGRRWTRSSSADESRRCGATRTRRRQSSSGSTVVGITRPRSCTCARARGTSRYTLMTVSPASSCPTTRSVCLRRSCRCAAAPAAAPMTPKAARCRSREPKWRWAARKETRAQRRRPHRLAACDNSKRSHGHTTMAC